MIFIVLTFLAAFLIEGLGTLVSVIGLSALFGSNPIIIALAIALDLGKIVTVSFLYTYWKSMGKIMKTYALLAAAVTMIITSAGASGYLSGEFQKAIVGTQESGLKVDVLKGQQAKYAERKKQIDDQVAALPEKYSANQRIRVTNQFKAEQADLTSKIDAIDKQLPDLQIKQIGVEAKAGPILYIAKAFNIPVESAVKYVILLIIFVFDPLAVFLIIAGNFLVHHRKVAKESAETNLFVEPAERLVVDLPNDVAPALRVPEVPNDSAAYAQDDSLPYVPDESVPHVHQGGVLFDADEEALIDSGTKVVPMEVAAAPAKTSLDAIRSRIPSLQRVSPEEHHEQQQRMLDEAEALRAEQTVRDVQSTPIVPEVPEEVPAEPEIEAVEPELVAETIPKPTQETVADVEPTQRDVEPTQRDVHTLSSLGIAKPQVYESSFAGVNADPHTVVDASTIDQVTPFKSEPYPRRGVTRT